MSKQKVLVTGAGGYIGRYVVKELLDCGYQVLAADIRLDEVDERAEKFYDNIFSGDEDIYQQMGCPDVCIHMAWRDGFKHDSNAHIDDIPKHVTFIENMIKGGLKNLNVMGSMHEIGYYEGMITADTPANPMSYYGIGKNTLRQICKVLANKNEVALKWLRAYYILGDDAKNNSIFAKIVHAENEGKETFPLNSGKNKYDFISIAELAEQIVAASVQTKYVNEINCCSGVPISLGEMVEKFIKERDYKIVPEYGKFPDRPYDSPEIYGDSSVIKNIINERQI